MSSPGSNVPACPTQKFTCNTPCKYFKKGACKLGATCRFIHVNPKDRKSPETHQQAITKTVCNQICKYGRRPFLHLVVLYASDPQVNSYAQEIVDNFLKHGVDVAVQKYLVDPPGAAVSGTAYGNYKKREVIRTENLAEIICSSHADFLIVIGDRNMKNKSCQAKRKGKLIEMGVNEMISLIWKSWPQNPHKTLARIQNLTPMQTELLLFQHCGLRHSHARVQYLRSLTNEFKTMEVSDEQFTTGLSNIQMSAIRLHKQFKKCIEIIDEIPVHQEDPELIRGSIMTLDYKPNSSRCPRHFISSTLKKHLQKVLVDLMQEVEEVCDALPFEIEAWEMYRKEHERTWTLDVESLQLVVEGNAYVYSKEAFPKTIEEELELQETEMDNELRTETESNHSGWADFDDNFDTDSDDEQNIFPKYVRSKSAELLKVPPQLATRNRSQSSSPASQNIEYSLASSAYDQDYPPLIGYVPFAKANDSSQSPRGTPEVAVSSPSSLSPPTFDVDLCGSLFGLSLQPPHPKPIKTKPPTNPRSIGGYSIRPPSSETLLTPPPLRHSFNTTIGSPVYPSAESSSSSLFDSTSPISSFERATEPKSKPFSTVVGSPPKSRSQISDLLSSYPPPSKNTFPHQTRPLNSLHVSSNTPTSQTPNDSPLEGPPHKAPSLLTPTPPNISPSFSTNFNNFNAPAMNYFPPLREHTLNAPPFNPNPDMNYHLKYHPYDTYNPQNHFNIPQADYPKNSIPRTPSINLPNQDYDEPTDADFSYALDNEFQLQYSPHLETNEHIPMQNSYSYGIPSHSPLNVSANKPNHLKQMNGGLHKSEGGGVENQRKNLQGLGGSGGLFGTPLSASGMEGCNEQFARISQIWGESFSVDDMQNTWATSQAFNETRDRSARRFPSSF